MPNQSCLPQPHHIHKCNHVSGQVRHIVPAGWPLRVTMAALVYGIGVVGRRERWQYTAVREPRIRVAVEQDYGTTGGVTLFCIMEPHTCRELCVSKS